MLRLSDGIASPADIERLKAIHTEEEIAGWGSISSFVRDTLKADDDIDIADRVLQTLIDEALIEPSVSIKDILLPPDNLLEVDVIANVFEGCDLELPDHPDTIIVEGIRDALIDPIPIDLTLNASKIMGAISETPTSNDLIQEFFAEQTVNTVLDEEDSLIPEVEIVTGQHLKVVSSEKIVEFTEEIPLPIENIKEINAGYLEEDSDEICTVDESQFVSEDDFNKQELLFTEFRSSVMDSLKDPNDEELSIWSAISSQVSDPPLRLLRDDEQGEPTEAPEVNQAVSPTNVEFLNSKSIDGDSTISQISITVLGSFLAIAAAWLVIVLPSQVIRTSGQINTPKRSIVTFEVAEINELQVENLEVGDNVNVQILQGELNAPTIIFIDEMEEE
jgi:hypothetical protein